MSENPYIPQDEYTFKTMVQEARHLLQKGDLPAEVMSHYHKFLKYVDISGDVDIHSVQNRRVFLACKKLLKYKENAPISTKEDAFDENMDYLGDMAVENLKLQDYYYKNPAYQALYEGIYVTKLFHMIPVEQKEKADVLAAKLFKKDLAKWGISESDLPSGSTDFRSFVYCNDADNSFNDWSLKMVLDIGLSDSDVSDGQGYIPFAVVAGHELLHVKQVLPGMSKNEFEYYNEHNELSPSLYIIERQDRIYKQINNIPLEQEVDYPQKLTIDGKEVNPGLIANKVRQWQEQYPQHSFDALLLTPEAKEFFKELAPNVCAEYFDNKRKKEHELREELSEICRENEEALRKKRIPPDNINPNLGGNHRVSGGDWRREGRSVDAVNVQVSTGNAPHPFRGENSGDMDDRDWLPSEDVEKVAHGAFDSKSARGFKNLSERGISKDYQPSPLPELYQGYRPTQPVYTPQGTKGREGLENQTPKPSQEPSLIERAFNFISRRLGLVAEDITQNPAETPDITYPPRTKDTSR